ncbi:MAG: ABC transporter permease [Gemmatimonadetes bacterium]|nr:ABC transporter permease [Gemmatimonadota bacterium]
MLESVGHDTRTALRALRHRPGGTVAAVLTLMLGIGATTALLGMVDHVLLRPLAYGEAEDLYSVWGVTESYDRIQPSYPDFVDWREGMRTLELAYAYGEVFAVRGDEGVEQATGSAVSRGFFGVLRTPPALGRTFAADEEREGAPVVVLSHGYWHRRFGVDPGVIRRELVIDGVSHTVVGVMPPGFEYPEWSSLWVPLARVQDRVPGLRQRDARVDARAIARPAAGVSAEAAEAGLRALAGRLAETYPASNEGLSVRLSRLDEEVIGEVRSSLLLMGLAGALVLLLTCANVAAILLGRGIERSRELAVRRALGADRRRLLRQLVTENVVLAGVGGLLGTIFAVVAVQLMARSAVAAGAITTLPLPRLGELGVDGRLLMVALGVTVLAALVFGVAPALSASGGDPALRLREQGRSGDVGRRAVRAQGGLAVAQLAIAVALLAGAALLVRTLDELRRTDPGFRPEGLLVLRVFPSGAYPSSNARLALYDRLAERAAAVPGVAGAALINHMPYAGGRFPTRVFPVGEAPADTSVGALYRTPSPGFFDVAGLPVLRGRGFDPGEAAADVVVLSESLAEALWPGGDVVGRQVRLVNPTPPSERRGETYTARVIGVAADVLNAPREAPLPTIYVPHGRDAWGNIFLVVRAAGEPGPIMAPLRTAVAGVDGSLPVADLKLLSDRVREATGRERVLARLMLGFAGLALVLSTVGIYGALSNLVLRRTRELGIRLALGARPGQVRRLVLRRALWIVIPGLAAGTVAALALGRVMEGLLFGITPRDPVIFLAAAALLGLAGLLAASVPAVRAGRVDPVELLGSE